MTAGPRRSTEEQRRSRHWTVRLQVSSVSGRGGECPGARSIACSESTRAPTRNSPTPGPSIPVVGVSGRDGAVFTYYAARSRPETTLWSGGGVLRQRGGFRSDGAGAGGPYHGASGDPQSPHYFDQAPCMRAGNSGRPGSRSKRSRRMRSGYINRGTGSRWSHRVDAGPMASTI
jgi:hypothetical protein